MTEPTGSTPALGATGACHGGGGTLRQWQVIERAVTAAEAAAFKKVFKHYDGRTNWKCTPVTAWRRLPGVTVGARLAFEAAGCRCSEAVISLAYECSMYYHGGPGTNAWLSHGSAWLCMPEGKSQAVLMTSDFLMLAMRQCMDGAHSGETLLARPHYGVLLANGLRSQRVANLRGLSAAAKQRAEVLTTTSRLTDIVTTKPPAPKAAHA